jgi:exopolysaccharide biosynthesis polyprenyl glycosylphosphotransferase
MATSVQSLENLPGELVAAGGATLRPGRPRQRRQGPFAGLDAVLLLAAALATNAALAGTGLAVSLAFAAATLAVLGGRGAYDVDRMTPPAPQVAAVLGASAVAAMGLFSAAALLGADIETESMAWLWLTATGLLAGQRAGAHLLRTRAVHSGRLSQATLIVGAGRIGHLAARRLLQDHRLALRPVGFLDDDPLADPGARADLPVLGASRELEQIVAEHDIEHVVIAFSREPDHVLLSLARRCQELGLSVSMVPRLFEVDGVRTQAHHLGALPLQALRLAPRDGWQLQLKYAADRVIAAVALAGLAPLLVGIAAAIRLTMGGPALYRQERIGRHGRPFQMLKFRTMRGDPTDLGEADADWASEMVAGLSAGLGTWSRGAPAGAERISRLGAGLRARSFDELPQLINVMRGEMSLVGPRPERSSYVELFAPSIYRYADRHRVKPGLSGWAQVNGLRGETSLDDRVEWDNFYVENWSWRLDARIIARTPASLRAPDGSSADGMEALRPVMTRPARRIVRKLLTLTVATLATLLAVSTTQAKAAPTPSAVDQYVEQLPTATGPTGLDRGTGAGRTSPLSPVARARLRPLDPADAERLERIATAAELGAPQQGLPRPEKPISTPAAPAAAVSALTGGEDGGRLAPLAIALVAVTLLAGGRAVHERRHRYDPA